jgi:hypothetical protein
MVMDIEIRWLEPMLLARNNVIVIDADFLPDQIPDEAGVYFFSRKFGDRFEPFYIGETGDLRGRLRSHLNSADIRDLLRGMELKTYSVKQGNKYFHAGVLIAKRGQQADRCGGIIQSYMIEVAIAQKHQLLNKQLTEIPTHSVEFTGSRNGKAIFPTAFNVKM